MRRAAGGRIARAVKRRDWFEEYLHRRARASQARAHEPADPKRRVNLILRLLGVIVPMVFCYGLGAFYLGRQGNEVGYWIARSLGGAAWLGLTAALAVRRDWPGVALTTVIYAFIDAWLWMTVTPA